MSKVSFFLFALLILAVALLFGGPEWFTVCGVAILVLNCPLPKRSIVITLPSFVWLGLSYATENRELYFPFTIYLATLAGLIYSRHTISRGTLAGLLVVAVFMTVRLLQSAPAYVLLLEFGVALAILQFSLIACSPARRRFLGDIAVAAIASVAAFGSLAL